MQIQIHNLDGGLMILPERVTIFFLAGDWILLNLLNLNLDIIILANLAVLIKLSFPLSKRIWIAISIGSSRRDWVINFFLSFSKNTHLNK